MVTTICPAHHLLLINCMQLMQTAKFRHWHAHVITGWVLAGLPGHLVILSTAVGFSLFCSDYINI